MKERHVQAIWYDGRLRPKNLFTRRGESVNVIDVIKPIYNFKAA